MRENKQKCDTFCLLFAQHVVSWLKLELDRCPFLLVRSYKNTDRIKVRLDRNAAPCSRPTTNVIGPLHECKKVCPCTKAFWWYVCNSHGLHHIYAVNLAFIYNLFVIKAYSPCFPSLGVGLGPYVDCIGASCEWHLPVATSCNLSSISIFLLVSCKLRFQSKGQKFQHWDCTSTSP